MKKYLIISHWEGISAKEEVTKVDLVGVKDGSIDYLIDTQENKYFDAKDNIWREIE